ncbi:MAG: DUF1800 domain-containing protein [Chloroflexi bacterium]|nr:DUF1800 domain-containing protein [Chloroflexota bacterium]
MTTTASNPGARAARPARTDLPLFAHLARRAAFGLPAWKLEELSGRPYEEHVEALIDIGRYERPEEDLLERYNIEHADLESYRWGAKRWFYRMINSSRHLEEKVALMWHNRFATAASKANNARAMLDHIELLRNHGMGNFRILLQQLSRNPAMIYWLDQHTNHAGAVNENYGRELLELFSMGRGNYTEDDVRAAAVSFSGWTIDQTIPRYPNGWFDTNFVYREDDHDDSEKTFLGETGRFNGDDIIDIVVRQPATARFVATTLYRWFVSDELDDEAISELAQVYFDSDYEISAMLRSLFNSSYFKDARWKRVRSPAEHVVYLMKLTGQHTNPYESGLGKISGASQAMGMELLNPPTVEGWHTGREWIDSAFLIERINFAADRLGNLEAPGVRKLVERVAAHGDKLTAEQLLDACLYDLGCVEIDAHSRAAILDEMGRDSVYETAADDFPDTATEVFQYIASTPMFQMA